MSKSVHVVRVLLGLVFVVFGFDGLIHFFPLPPMPDAARNVLAVLISYRLFYVVKAFEIACGALLLANRYVTLALCLLAPIIFNIVWFDLNLDRASLPVGLLVSAMEAFLLFHQRPQLQSLFESIPSTAPRGVG